MNKYLVKYTFGHGDVDKVFYADDIESAKKQVVGDYRLGICSTEYGCDNTTADQLIASIEQVFD